jgi:hypothetical protein
MRKIAKKEYMAHLKNKLIKHIKELATEDDIEEDSYNQNMKDIKRAETVGELFVCMSEMAFDIPGAVTFAMEDLISGAGRFEFMDCPMRNWDT